MNTQLFEHGHIVATPGALELAERGISLLAYLSLHLKGNWGDLDEHDKKENDFSVKNGYRILSSYNIGFEKLWIITEADRSITTFLLPSEY